MENMQPQDSAEFMFRRLAEECPWWAIGVPVLFAFLVVAMIVFFKQDKKLLTAGIGSGVVGVISAIYLVAAYFLSIHSPIISTWLVILIPVMAVALFYVALMYVRDAGSVHWMWAIFLGLLRVSVYLILACVFLLPGCQHHDKQEFESRVLILFDVSDSMFEADDAVGNEDPKNLQKRQEKVLKFLTAEMDEKKKERKAFVGRAVAKSPLFVYRFGDALDKGEVLQINLKNQSSFGVEEWKRFLGPDVKHVKEPDYKGLTKEEEKAKKEQYLKRLDDIAAIKKGTNIGGALLEMHKMENSSYIQAIIVISDGQSNKGGDEAREFLTRVNNPKAPIPVLTVGVGRNRVRTEIKVHELNAPAQTRPDDSFRVRVPVVATGLPGQPFTATLEMTRVRDVTGEPTRVLDAAGKITKQDDVYILPEQKGVFKGSGDTQQGYVDFEVNVQALRNITIKDDPTKKLEGQWEIFARVPRHKNEIFQEPFHESKKTYVQIQNSPLRVLLFAGGPSREYQFLRTILYREDKEQRMVLCIHNQSSGKDDHVDQDVPEKQMLAEFPNTLGKADQPFMSLADYDVIVAFDPDWTKLSVKQRDLLFKWVETNAGGFIFVAGPVFSHQMARPAGEDFSKILPLIPVVLKDARLHGIGLAGVNLGHDTSRPYALGFTPAAKQYDFLKLDEAGNSPIAGWNGFFFNNEDKVVEPGQDLRPRRGMFTYYPVERTKAGTEVVAYFAGPKESRIGEKTDAFKDQQPFIATMPLGLGKTMYIGSGEFWRLRAYKEGFQERLWIKMARYVAAASKGHKKYGRIVMVSRDRRGRFEFEAQLKGADLEPAAQELRPTVRVVRKNQGEQGPDKDKKEVKGDPKKGEVKRNEIKFDLSAKPFDREWEGHFWGYTDDITEPGDYEFRLDIPNMEGEPPLRETRSVAIPNPEKDNVNTNFSYLYSLASPAQMVTKSLPDDTRTKIERLLQPPEGYSAAVGAKGGKRLFFPLENADSIADCLVEVPSKSDTIKGRFEYLWDRGFKFEWNTWVFLTILLIPLGLGLVGGLLSTLIWDWTSGLACFLIFFFFAALGSMFYVFQLGWNIEIFWAVLLTPLIIGAIGAGILSLLQQWVSAAAFFGAGVALSGFALLFTFFPVLTLVLMGGSAGVGAVGYTIYALVKQEYFGIIVLGVLGGAAVGIVVLLHFQLRDGFSQSLADSIWNDSLEIGFSVVLILIATLIGVEWLTRKLLRLA